MNNLAGAVWRKSSRGIDQGQCVELAQAQDGDPDDPFTKGLRGSYNELEAQEKATLATVAELDAADEAEPGRPNTDDTALLDSLPTWRST